MRLRRLNVDSSLEEVEANTICLGSGIISYNTSGIERRVINLMGSFKSSNRITSDKGGKLLLCCLLLLALQADGSALATPPAPVPESPKPVEAEKPEPPKPQATVVSTAQSTQPIAPSETPSQKVIKLPVKEAVSKPAKPAAKPPAQKAAPPVAPELPDEQLPVANPDDEQVPVTATEPALEKIGDEENLPIFLDAEQSQSNGLTPSGLAWRMGIGLLTVLGLFFAFTRWVLPKWAEKFNRTPDESTDLLGLKKLNRPTKPQLPQGWKDARFNVITSSPLGKDKELHLVEIGGHYLILATSPYTVTLIQDLTDNHGSRPPMSELDNLMEQVSKRMAPESDRGWREIENQSSWTEPVFFRLGSRSGAGERLKLETHSAERAIRPKPLADKVPESTQSASWETTGYSEDAGGGEFIHRREPLHMRYLQAKKGEHESLRPSQQETLPPGLRALYQDAEDVVILDDYDDVYPDRETFGNRQHFL